MNPKVVNDAVMYKAAYEKELDLISGYSTDGRIKAFDLYVLEDDKKIFPPYFAAPIIKTKTLEKFPELEKTLNICIELSHRYEIHFLEIGYEENHVHFLIQSIPNLSISEICMKVKSITAKEIFKRFPEIKTKLWGENFWISGYYANTVGQYGNKDVIKKYIENQGKEKNIKKCTMLNLHFLTSTTPGLSPGVVY